MTSRIKQLFVVSVGIGTLIMTARLPHAGGPHIGSVNGQVNTFNGLQLNALPFNSDRNNHQPTISTQPDWIDPDNTQVMLSGQAVESISLESGQLSFKLTK